MKVNVLLNQYFVVEDLKNIDIGDKFVTFTALNGDQFKIPLAAFAGVGLVKSQNPWVEK